MSDQEERGPREALRPWLTHLRSQCGFTDAYPCICGLDDADEFDAFAAERLHRLAPDPEEE